MKLTETPTRHLRPRPGRLGYWLRRPEPSLVVGVALTVWPMAEGLRERDWFIGLLSLIGLATVAFIWKYREGARFNADRWRQGHRDVW
jgi:hypothetical protein